MTQSSDISVAARAADSSPDAQSRAADRPQHTPSAAVSSGDGSDWRDWVAPLASLKLTVCLLVLSIFLTFAGSVAQIDRGIWTVMDEYFRCAIAWIELSVFFPRTWGIPKWMGFWFPGGWLLGGMLLTNLLAAHAVRFRVKKGATRLIEGAAIIAACCVAFGLMLGELHFRVQSLRSYNAEMLLIMIVAAAVFGGCRLVFGKRAGIAMLHGGLIFLLISEVITGLYQVEGVMTIPEGGSMNYVESQRRFELAVVDGADPKLDRVVVVPASRLRAAVADKSVVTDAQLPFDIVVDQYMPNSTLTRIGPNVKNPATAGAGLEAFGMPIDEYSGAGEEAGMTDRASAYVTLRPKGQPDAKPLGTWLVSQHLSDQSVEQTVDVEGKPYRIALRFERMYQPFTLHLIDFQHKKFVGTDTPRDFRSIVQLVNPTTGDDRQVQIYMNHPLRHAGKTFFQHQFRADPNTGDSTVTILQVVDNPGRLVPYIACFLVAVGLVGHFMTHLIGFLSRRAPA